MYKQGDVVLIPFPYSDLTNSKLRPALIISNERLKEINDKICCLVTTSSRTGDLEIQKNDFEFAKLPFKSWVRPYRLFTLDERIVRKRLCTLNKKFNLKLIKKVNEYLR